MTENTSRLVLDPALLPDLEQWRDQSGELPSFSQYLAIRGDPELGAAFARFFWPEFVLVEDCVLLKEHFDRSSSSFEEWEACDGDPRRIEATINHEHVWDLFPNADDEHLDGALFEFIGRVIQRCWTNAVQEAFPDRQFVVEYVDERDDENEYGPTVYLYQAESSPETTK